MKKCWQIFTKRDREIKVEVVKKIEFTDSRESRKSESQGFGYALS